MAEPTRGAHALRVRVPIPFLDRLTMLAALALPGAAHAYGWLGSTLAVPMALGAVASVLFARWRSTRLELAEVEVRSGELLLHQRDATRAISLGAIAHAELAHGGATLRLYDARRALLAELEVRSLEEAEAWIEALGLSSEARRSAWGCPSSRSARTRSSCGF